MEGTGTVEVALGVQNIGQVVEAGRSRRVVDAQDGLADGHGALQQAARLLMISALPEILASLVEQPSGGLRLDCECLGVFGHGQGMREQPRVTGHTSGFA